MTTYIAGPMSGLPEFNYPAFNEVAAELRSQGVEVLNPTEHTDDGKPPAAYDAVRTYGWYLRRSLLMLLECDAVVMLPGCPAGRRHAARSSSGRSRRRSA